jgi:hypothetical protein
MTSEGSGGRFTRAIKQRNLFLAEMAIREMGGLASLDEGLDYLDLLAEVKPEKLEHGALRWHGRLELEASTMTLAESQLALAALASLCAGEPPGNRPVAEASAASATYAHISCRVSNHPRQTKPVESYVPRWLLPESGRP